jgi:hypothetical protein
MKVEPRSDIVTLPSEGKFYKNGAKRVKLFYLDGADEGILTSPNLLESGDMVDFLLKRKVAPVDGEPFVDPDHMLLGDRLALVVMLRATLDPIYKLRIPYMDNGQQKFFIHEVNLQELKVRDINLDLPYDKENGEFSFQLPTSKLNIKFRMMTGIDEQKIRKTQNKESLTDEFKFLRLCELVTEVEGERDEAKIRNAVSKIPLRDFRILNKNVTEVMPSLDLVIAARPPRGEVIYTFLKLDREFWFPTL